MNTAQHYRINDADTLSELIDDEVIIINSQTGAYYHLQNLGASVWVMIQEGLTGTDIVTRIARRFNRNLKEVQEAVGEFLAELQREQLVVVGNAAALPAPSPHNHLLEQITKYEKPGVRKYTDLADVLALEFAGPLDVEE